MNLSETLLYINLYSGSSIKVNSYRYSFFFAGFKNIKLNQEQVMIRGAGYPSEYGIMKDRWLIFRLTPLNLLNSDIPFKNEWLTLLKVEIKNLPAERNQKNLKFLWIKNQKQNPIHFYGVRLSAREPGYYIRN